MSEQIAARLGWLVIVATVIYFGGHIALYVLRTMEQVVAVMP